MGAMKQFLKEIEERCTKIEARESELAEREAEFASEFNRRVADATKDIRREGRISRHHRAIEAIPRIGAQGHRNTRHIGRATLLNHI